MISVGVRAAVARTRLTALALQLKNRAPVNKVLAARMFAMVMENFEKEGHEGKPWTPLAPSTLRWKRARGYLRILQNTGALRQSFLPFSDREQAGVGAKQMRPRVHGDPRGARREPDMAKRHEEGIRVPRRKMLPSREKALKEAVKIYGAFVARATFK